MIRFCFSFTFPRFWLTEKMASFSKRNKGETKTIRAMRQLHVFAKSSGPGCSANPGLTSVLNPVKWIINENFS